MASCVWTSCRRRRPLVPKEGRGRAGHRGRRGLVLEESPLPWVSPSKSFMEGNLVFFPLVCKVGPFLQTRPKRSLGESQVGGASWAVILTPSHLPRKVSATPRPQDSSSCLCPCLVSGKGHSKCHSELRQEQGPKTTGKGIPGTPPLVSLPSWMTGSSCKEKIRAKANQRDYSGFK